MLLISRTKVLVPVTKLLVCGLEKWPQSALPKIDGSRFTALVPKNVLASPTPAAPPTTSATSAAAAGALRDARGLAALAAAARAAKTC